MCREVDSPLSRKVLSLLESSVISSSELPDIDPDSYDDPLSLIKDRQVLGIITKWPGLHLSDDPEDACRKTYYKFEQQCLETNLSFESGRLFDPDVEAVLLIAREKILKLLGSSPPSISELSEDFGCTFGPGASRNVRRRTSAYFKLEAEAECTLNAKNDVLRLMKGIPWLWTHFGGSNTEMPKLKIVHGSRFGQVPKSAKTNRPIDIEPTWNGVLQRLYGSQLRKKLRRGGNCINSGQLRHATLSREGSITKQLATIDKSGASDSISTALVMRLLPWDWFDALDNARSHLHEIDGKIQHLEKFSAMGNGFTFELESVIFLCLARAVAQYLEVKGPISVYGDDLICPQGIVELYYRVCDACGFTINQEKSFEGASSFRESCGYDWYNGIDVRVAYMRHNVSPHYLTSFHNRMHDLGLQHVFPKSFARLREIIPQRFRTFGPPSHHKYGYLFCDEVRESCSAITVRPKQHVPKGAATYAYGMYTLQFLSCDSDTSDPFSVDDLGHIRFDDSKVSLDMSRFTIRNDFKLARRRIHFDGTLPPPRRNFSKRDIATWENFK
jgi:hypothetical protein